MAQRALFVLITAFFVTMNVLLWRAEVAGGDEAGGKVPVEVVFQRILTAPDNSAMAIRHRKENIGYARWSANIGEEAATGKVASEEFTPEQQVKRLAYYTIDFDGSISLRVNGTNSRVRFFVAMKFDTNQNWQEFSVRLTQRPLAFGIQADKAAETLRLEYRESGDVPTEDNTFTRELKFADLRDPRRLLAEAGGSSLAMLLSAPLAQLTQKQQEVTTGFQWQARHDWMEIHTARVRVYRLSARLFADREIRVYVSRVGEILKVELPDGLVLVNDELRQ